MGEGPAKAREVEKARPPIGTGCSILQMIKSVIMALAWHGEILQRAVAHVPQTGMYAPSANGGKIQGASEV